MSVKIYLCDLLIWTCEWTFQENGSRYKNPYKPTDGAMMIARKCSAWISWSRAIKANFEKKEKKLLSSWKSALKLLRLPELQPQYHIMWYTFNRNHKDLENPQLFQVNNVLF